VNEELLEVLNTAIYQEVAAQALYRAAQSRTDDPGAVRLFKDLEAEEVKHAGLLKEMQARGAAGEYRCHPEQVPNLRLSDYLKAPGTLQNVGLQEALAFAIKREQEAVDFYSRMMGALRDAPAKAFCECLVQDELKHKLKLEMFYEELFLKEG